jgi:hypothetical protein
MERNSPLPSAIAAIVALGMIGSGCASDPPPSPVSMAPATSETTTSFPEPAAPLASATVQVQFDNQLAMEAIREFMESPDLTLNFIDLETMVNSMNADVVVAVFEDGTGTTYSVDPRDYRVLELAPIVFALSDAPRLSQAELRERAEAMAEHYLLGFNEIKDRLVYEEGTKGDNFFFRWEDPVLAWLYNPPIFQVGLRVDGKLVAYLNTIPAP